MMAVCKSPGVGDAPYYWPVSGPKWGPPPTQGGVPSPPATTVRLGFARAWLYGFLRQSLGKRRIPGGACALLGEPERRG